MIALAKASQADTRIDAAPHDGARLISSQQFKNIQNIQNVQSHAQSEQSAKNEEMETTNERT